MTKLLLAFLFLTASLANAQNPHVVHFVYLIPTDKTNVAEQAIANAAQDLQSWYQGQMGNAKTFTLHDPVVEVYYTPHDSNWYSTHVCCPPYVNDPEQSWWFDNVVDDANALAGVWFCQEFNSWVVYIDAPSTPDQYGGTSGSGCVPNTYSGVSTLGSKDLASLMGIDPDWTLCRGRGGSGHEMGLGFGLIEHFEDQRLIMGVGYTIYPGCLLAQSDKDTLNQSPFFTVQPAIVSPDGLCQPSPTPTPSATATPTSAPLPVPHANGADQVQNTSFRARWNAVSGATSYRIDVSYDTTFLFNVLANLNVGNALNFTVTGLQRQTDYYYRLRAHNDVTGASSPNSNVVHVKTK